jgi:hypothetical protein
MNKKNNQKLKKENKAAFFNNSDEMRNATYFVAVITKAADTHKFSTQQTIQRQ